MRPHQETQGVNCHTSLIAELWHSTAAGNPTRALTVNFGLWCSENCTANVNLCQMGTGRILPVVRGRSASYNP